MLQSTDLSALALRSEKDAPMERPPTPSHRDPEPTDPGFRFSRRGFLTGVGASSAAAALPAALGNGVVVDDPVFAHGEHPIELTINGVVKKLAVEPRTTLLDALREKLDLTGAKRICDRGSCGGCTVLVDDQPVYACMTLALDTVGAKVRTVEGLATGNTLHPIQQAFVAHDATQCGFCTPGMVMAAVACYEQHAKPDRATVQGCLAGSLCRCGT
jgi:aerobic-type carbon monoxide dehydrogenase small subunit (CoxS/CutS family)